MTTVENGNTVSVHYRGTFPDGEEFDSSYSREQPLTFTVGNGETISGFETAVMGMTAGETKNITISAADGYGEINPDAFHAVPKTQFSPDFVPQIGLMVEGTNPNGQRVRAVISEVDDQNVTLNFNHPMAGKEMNFEIQLLSFEQRGSSSIGRASAFQADC